MFFLQKVYLDDTLKKKMKIQGSLGDAIFEVLGKKSSVPIAHILTWLHDSFLTCKILLRALSASAWASLSLQPCPRQSSPIPQPARPTKCILAPKLFVRSPDLDSSPLLSLGWGKHPWLSGSFPQSPTTSWGFQWNFF